MEWNKPVISERDLARTDNGGADEDPRAAVGEYQAAIRDAGDHPNTDSSAIATALEIPRGRTRPWLCNPWNAAVGPASIAVFWVRKL